MHEKYVFLKKENMRKAARREWSKDYKPICSIRLELLSPKDQLTLILSKACTIYLHLNWSTHQQIYRHYWWIVSF